MSNRFVGCAMLTAVAWFFATALHIPVWRNWEPGDQTDIVLTTFMGLWFLTSPRGDQGD